MLFESLLLVAAIGFCDGPQADVSEAPKAETAKPVEAVPLFPAENEIVQWTNAQRKRHGLPPLVVDASLEKTARNHTFWMASVQSLQHAQGAWAENIAQGQISAQHAVSSWMNSSGHRANILNRRHRRIGVAGFVGRNGQVYWCQQFKE
ncbi:MAG TPA: CAP domain-containing protein [Pirellulales bacterium]|nr:CAP domain-containing protein [Pirellulales bacterium]